MNLTLTSIPLSFSVSYLYRVYSGKVSFGGHNN